MNQSKFALMIKSLKILLVLFVGCSTNSFSQQSDIGNWFIYFGNQAINSKWNWHNEVQYRNFNFVGDTNQLLVRTGIGYNLSENNNNVLLGYGFINTQRYVNNSDDKVSTNEHRIFQQFITRQNFGRFFLQHRYRIEERFLPNDFQLRFRYFLGLNVPITKKTLEKNTLYFSAYNELFVNAEKPLFDRNRLYGALGFVINKNFKAEAGFMAQTLENSNRNQFQIVIFNNLPF
ncbi:MAG: DUF2490 domain-containing protein [Flavobacterium sp.]|nr:DUF2490 domain-containing protein [Flavobacterium sp.]